MLTQQRLKELLHYNLKTGDFSRAITTRNGHRKGTIAGSVSVKGYWNIRVDRKLYYAHRLAWLYVTGEWPKYEIDHINGDPLDNCFNNLRETTHAQNMKNMKRHKDNKSGHKGIHWNEQCRAWQVNVFSDGKRKYSEMFKSLTAAIEARNIAIRLHHGKFANLDTQPVFQAAE